MLTANQRRRLVLSAERAEKSSSDPTRHKCFLSYHSGDVAEVETFIDTFGEVFIPRVIGVTDEDDFIDSGDTGYVMNRIRDKYLRESTVTIVLVGRCTWARRYVDWEIYSTLRRDPLNRLSGLMAVTLPSVANSTRELPARAGDNVMGPDGDTGYGRWWKYPTSKAQLRGYVQDAYDARDTRSTLIDNTRARRLRSAAC